ncbi:MAG: hypothetical protein B9S38_00440 [Verrucomicrobiia bacterium Tous-C4TDCM]|nr:MAG: hypothetical protein B9S38_00440 [Verrucomicrobiae bacterium Tous-C4TDCM]
MLRTPLALLLGLTFAISAQETRKISLRTLCFAHTDGVVKVFVAGSEPGTSTEVPLFTETFSRPVEVVAIDGKLTFAISAPTAGQAKEPTPALPAVKLPYGSKILCLFLPNAGKKGQPYQVVAVADDLASFPLGSVKLMNLTPAVLRFDLGEHAGPKGVTVEPGKTGMLASIRKVNHLNQYDAKGLYQMKPGEFVQFYNSRWRSVAAKRDIAIAYLDPQSKQPMANLYEDAPAFEIPKQP